MKIDVFFTAAGVQPADVQGRTVVVVDVLRRNLHTFYNLTSDVLIDPFF